MTRGRLPLDTALATPDSKRQYVRRLFSTIADRYDFITVLLSFGMDARWKRRVVALASPRPGQRVLDLACGTGDLAFSAAAAGAQVVGLDITFRMLELARIRRAGRGVRGADAGRAARPFWIQGDMLSLPFADESFDIVTTGYGLRNVPDLRRSIAEIRRVLRPGGMLLSLDFNRPANPVLRSIYLGYLWLVGGMLGWILHGDPDTYRYIPASIQRYPGAPGVVQLMKDEGFTEVRWIPVLGGLMAIHLARRQREAAQFSTTR